VLADRQVEEAMIKVLYKLVGMLVGLVAGALAGAIFKGVWKIAAHEDEAPKATDARRGWREVLIAAALQGAIIAVIRAVAYRGAAEGTRKLTGVWPGEEGRDEADEADEGRSPQAASLFIPNGPGCQGPQPCTHPGGSAPPAARGDDGLLTAQAPHSAAAARGGTIGHIPFACVHARHPGLV
jgi:hypothetical protein